MSKRIYKSLIATVLAFAMIGSPISMLPKNQEIIQVNAAAVKLNKKEITLKVGQSKTLKLTGTKNKIKWRSKNTKVATVTSKGKVTGRKSGVTFVIAKVKTKQKETIELVCIVRVDELTDNSSNEGQEQFQTQGTSLQQLVLDKTSIVMSVGEKQAINVSFVPSDYSGDRVINWESSDESIVKVSNGIVEAIGSGSATISASCGSKVAACYVEVSQSYGSITGNVTYFYNNYKGNVPDTKSYVILIPKDGSSKVIERDLDVCFLISINNSSFEKYKIYGTRVDGNGSYTINNIECGEYLIYIKSENTTSEVAFNDLDRYRDNVSNDLSQYLDSKASYNIAKHIIYQKCVIADVTIIKDQTQTYSHDFGMTYN